MARSYTPLTLKRLFATSGHYCAYPKCSARTIDFDASGGIVILGEIAHIEASSDKGPRARPELTKLQRDHDANLLVLCGHHHTVVDKLDSEYSVETLRNWKADAQRAVSDRLEIGAIQVSFAELEIVCSAFADGDIAMMSTPMVAVPPALKMTANDLTVAVQGLMLVGLSQAPLVADYIRRQAQISAKFPERIRAGFVQEYDKLKGSGLHGDDLFVAMVDFGAASSVTPQTEINRMTVLRAAALGVLCHLFEVCDVFEAPA